MPLKSWWFLSVAPISSFNQNGVQWSLWPDRVANYKIQRRDRWCSRRNWIEPVEEGFRKIMNYGLWTISFDKIEASKIWWQGNPVCFLWWVRFATHIREGSFVGCWVWVWVWVCIRVPPINQPSHSNAGSFFLSLDSVHVAACDRIWKFLKSPVVLFNYMK